MEGKGEGSEPLVDEVIIGELPVFREISPVRGSEEKALRDPHHKIPFSRSGGSIGT